MAVIYWSEKMTNVTAPQKNWWLASANCVVCAVSIRKHHLSRHAQSKGHRARVGNTYEVMPSDLAFSAFLSGITGDSLAGYESQLYRVAGAQNDVSTPR